MSDFIDRCVEPGLWLLGNWSLRWGVLIGVLWIGLTIRPPRQAALRLVVCQAAFLGGLALPLIPHWWGHHLSPARSAVAANDMPADRAMTEPPDSRVDDAFVEPKAATVAVSSQPVAVAVSNRSETPPTELAALAPRPVGQSLGLFRIVLLTTVLLWLIGACAQLVRLAAGAIYLSRLPRGAQQPSLHAQELFDRCREEIGLRRCVRLGLHPTLSAPVFVGGRNACILVPADWEQLAPEAQRAILWHELAHAARRDDAAKVAEEVIRAMFFFHPFVHWLLNRIDAYREQVCDSAAVRRGITGGMLAQILVDFSRRSAAPGRLDSALHPALPFFRRRTVKNRIRELLEEKTVARWSAPLVRRQVVGLAVIAISIEIALGGFGPHAAASALEPALTTDSDRQSPAPLASTTAPEKPPATPNEAVGSKTVERIRANWSARQQRTQSVYVSWESRIFVAQAEKNGASTKPEVPRSTQYSFWAEGRDLFRLDSGPLATQQSTRDALSAKTHTVINGSTELRVEDPSDSAGGAVGTLLRRRGQGGWPWFSPRALGVAFHPMDGFFLFIRWPMVRVVSEDAVAEGLHCVEIQIANGKWRENCWVDPARGDILVAYEFHIEGNARSNRRISIEYQLDRAHGWIPARWTSRNPRERSENTVTRYAINEPFPRDTFTLNAAPGTIVFNERRWEQYRVAKDGAKTDIVQFDSPRSFEIAKILESRSNFDVQRQSLKDALDFIAARHRFPIVVSPVDYEAVGIKPAIEVGPLTSGLQAADLLKKLLARSPRPVGFAIEDEVLKISPRFAGQAAIPKPARTPQKVESPQAKRIQAMLESPIDFSVEPQPLKDALDYIAARYQLVIETDPAVPLTSEVHFGTPGIPGIRLSSLLTLLLEQSPKPLGFKIEDDALKIYAKVGTP